MCPCIIGTTDKIINDRDDNDIKRISILTNKLQHKYAPNFPGRIFVLLILFKVHQL